MLMIWFALNVILHSPQFHIMINAYLARLNFALHVTQIPLMNAGSVCLAMSPPTKGINASPHVLSRIVNNAQKMAHVGHAEMVLLLTPIPIVFRVLKIAVFVRVVLSILVLAAYQASIRLLKAAPPVLTFVVIVLMGLLVKSIKMGW